MHFEARYERVYTYKLGCPSPPELTPEHQLPAHRGFCPKGGAGAVEDTSGQAVITFL